MASNHEDLSTMYSITRGYLPLSHYSLIGDCRTVALVADDGAIDWLCAPGFDGNPVFARVVGVEHGGFFAITESESAVLPRPIRQAYQPDTAILATEIALATGTLLVTDFMPIAGADANRDEISVVRQITALQGTPTFALRVKASRAYGNAIAPFVPQSGSAQATDGPYAFTLTWDDPAWQASTEASGWLTVMGSLAQGQSLIVTFACAPAQNSIAPVDGMAERQFTQDFWTAWVAGLTYQGAYSAAVIRSAITLKLLTYAPTGATVAAPTSSLPERIGGDRNWDYRFAWLRDSAFTVDALTALGQRAEARAWMAWLGQRERQSAFELRTIYTIRGERDLPEYVAPALTGYQASSPVRVGNAAADQTQLDIYGEWLDSVAHTYESVPPAPWLRELVIASVDHVCAHWAEPDQGIWEIRSEAQHFVYSKVMCWVAVERGLTLAERFGWQQDVSRWRAVAEEIRQWVMRNGIDVTTGGFKMSLETAAADAANLLIPLVGFLPATDAHCVATTQSVMDELQDEQGFIYRYKGFEDGVGGTEGTFVICSFWLAENLALQGRFEEATALFERLLSHATPTGLLSEMIDSHSGALLGNYPQAFSHLGLIRTALALAARP
jgi:GH15 family glucan-1,4-alpha-glucosidase